MTLADFTDEEIAQLQKPATDAIALCNTATDKANTATANANAATERASAAAENATDKATAASKLNDTVAAAETSRVAAENARVTAENARAAAESSRAAAESARDKAETSRASEETARQADEKTRQANETQRQTDTAAAISNSEAQTEIAKNYNEHPPKIGDNGNWWTWNGTEYADTGYPARGGTLYPTFYHTGNKLYIRDTTDTVAQYVKRKGNKVAFSIYEFKLAKQ